MMLGSNICISISFIYFGLTWILLSPVALLTIIVMKARTYEPIKGFPDFANALGWLMVAAVVFLIPVWFIIYTCMKGVGQTCIKLNSPTKAWGPANPEDRTGPYADNLPFTDYTSATTNGDTKKTPYQEEHYYQEKVNIHSVSSPGKGGGVENTGYVPHNEYLYNTLQDDVTKF